MSSQTLALSPQQAAVKSLVELCGQATASQVRRALYRGTPRGATVRAQRHLKALTERGVIRRLGYKLSGYERGSGEFVYGPSSSKARIPNLHMLDITEIGVRLIEVGIRPMEFWPEPWSHDTWGGVRLEPDFYAKVAGRMFFGELDRSTEHAAALSHQMNAYLRAFYGADGDKVPEFPKVLFICHNPERQRFIEREVAKKSLRALFEVCLIEDATGVMTGDHV